MVKIAAGTVISKSIRKKRDEQRNQPHRNINDNRRGYSGRYVHAYPVSDWILKTRRFLFFRWSPVLGIDIFKLWGMDGTSKNVYLLPVVWPAWNLVNSKKNETETTPLGLTSSYIEFIVSYVFFWYVTGSYRCPSMSSQSNLYRQYCIVRYRTKHVYPNRRIYSYLA